MDRNRRGDAYQWAQRKREVAARRMAAPGEIPSSFRVGQTVRLAYGPGVIGQVVACKGHLLRVRWPNRTRWCSAASIAAIL